jgi:hypothetical protein
MWLLKIWERLVEEEVVMNQIKTALTNHNGNLQCAALIRGAQGRNSQIVRTSSYLFKILNIKPEAGDFFL